MHLHWRPVYILLLLIAFSGCRRKFNIPKSDADVVFPIIKSSVDFSRLIEPQYLDSSNGQIVIVFSDNLVDLSIDSFLSIPDTSFLEQYQLPFSATLAPGALLSEGINKNQLNVQSILISEILISTGTLDFKGVNTIPEKLLIEYGLQGLAKSGNPFRVVDLIGAGGGPFAPPASLSSTFDLSGYRLDLTGALGNRYNTLAYDYSFRVDSAAPGLVSTVAGDFAEVAVKYSQLIPAYIKGYFGNQNLDLREEDQELDLFSNIKGGRIDFFENSLPLNGVNVTFTLTNAIGVDFRVKINSIVGRNSSSGESVSLNGPLVNNSLNITRATDKGNDEIQTTRQTFFFDNQTNIARFISILPDQISYDIELETNPLGNISNSNDFFYSDQSLDIKLDAQIPLNFAATEIVLWDTITMNFKPEDQTKLFDNVESGIMKLYVDNSYPFGAEVQFVMLDSNYQLLGSIFEQPQLVLPAVIGEFNNQSIESKESILEAPLNQDQLDALFKTKYIQLETKVNTGAMSDTVKVLFENRMDITAVAEMRYKLDFENEE